LSEEELGALDWDRHWDYWLAITVIEAQETLTQLAVADYPWRKADEREKVYERYHRMAYPKTYDQTEVLTTDQLAKRLNEAING
jgi:hypothetical protein